MSAEDPVLDRTIAGVYRVEALIGSGSMGSVYRARHLGLDKIVAIKVLHREMTHDERFVARFRREAMAASRLDHPSSVRVLDFGTEADGLLYIVMEHLEGRDLLDVLAREAPLDDRRIVRIVGQVLAALSVAHDQRVIHRDLKPENIMILKAETDDGTPVDLVKVCDFGIATLANSAEGGPFARSLTSKGLLVGTPEYMSPEQARGDALDLRSDLYSVGVILYEMLAGVVPFTGDTAVATAIAHVTSKVVPPSQHRPVHAGLEQVCLKALAKEPAERWSSAREMRAALRRALVARTSRAPQRVSRAAPTSVTSVAAAILDAPRADTLSNVAHDLAGHAPRAQPARSPSRAGLALFAVVAIACGGYGAARHFHRSAAIAAPAAVAHESTKLAEPVTAVPVVTVAKTTPAAAPSPIAPPKRQVVAPTVAAPAFDPSKATVTIGAIITSDGLPAGAVRSALDHALLSRCHRSALTANGAPAPGDATLHLSFDASGKVATASLGDASFLPTLKGCVEAAARTLTVQAEEPEGATADVRLTFQSN